MATRNGHAFGWLARPPTTRNCEPTISSWSLATLFSFSPRFESTLLLYNGQTIWSATFKGCRSSFSSAFGRIVSSREKTVVPQGNRAQRTYLALFMHEGINTKWFFTWARYGPWYTFRGIVRIVISADSLREEIIVARWLLEIIGK